MATNGLASMRSDCADSRTPAHRHLANAIVGHVGHEHVSVRIDGHTRGVVEASAGPGRIGIRSIGAIDAARK